jgi:hypothetical protein
VTEKSGAHSKRLLSARPPELAADDALTGRVVFTPMTEHVCRPPVPQCFAPQEYYPRGTVWMCGCGRTWRCRGLTDGGAARRGGHGAGGLEWTRESRIRRWWRETR